MTGVNTYPLAADFRVEVGPPWAPPEALHGRIDAIWQHELQERGAALTDGRICCLADFGRDRLVIRPAQYRHALARRRDPGLVGLGLDLRPVAVTGVLACRDGVVLGQRGKIVADDAGRWEPAPAGGLSGFDPLAQVLAELEEELGIAASDIGNATACALVEDVASGVVDVVFRLQTGLTGPAIRAAHRAGRNAEYADLAIVPQADLPRFLGTHADRVIPALVPILRAAGLV